MLYTCVLGTAKALCSGLLDKAMEEHEGDGWGRLNDPCLYGRAHHGNSLTHSLLPDPEVSHIVPRGLISP